MRKYLFLTLFLLIMALPVQAAATMPLADGQYQIEVTLSGGTGRAQVESPTQLTVADGAAKAVVIWSSPYYEYMLVDGNYYYPVNTEGNSTFEIPVSLDQDMAVSAQTVAMSEPHVIDYTLHFDSATMKPLAGDEPAPTATPTAPTAPPSATPIAPTPTIPAMMAAMAAAVLIALTAAGLLMAAWRRRTKKQKATKEK